MTVITDYINDGEKSHQPYLNQVYRLIKAKMPTATEAIKYQMPTFQLNGKNIVHFACFKNHLGFYPEPLTIAHFAPELKAANFKFSKGAIQFPYERELPVDLITQMLDYRLSLQ